MLYEAHAPDPDPQGACECACFLSHPASAQTQNCLGEREPGLTRILHSALFGQVKIPLCGPCHAAITAAEATSTTGEELKTLVRYVEEGWEENQGWNCAPQLFFYFPPALVGVALSEEEWSRVNNDPVHMMRKVGEAWPAFREQMAASIPPEAEMSEQPTALILLAETWGFDKRHPKNADGDPEEYLQVAAAGMIHAHPDRLEMRVTYCVSGDGALFTLQRIRDMPPEEQHGEDGVRGMHAIVAGMRELITLTRQ